MKGFLETIRQRLHDSDKASSLLCVCMLGILLGSVWTSRGLKIFGDWPTSSVTHIASIVVCLAFAFAPKQEFEKRAGAVISGCMAAHILTVALTTVLTEPSELFALGILSGAFEGTALGAGQVAAFLFLCRMGGNRCTVGIASAFLLANVYDSLFIAASSAAILSEWIAAAILSSAIAVFLPLPKDEGPDKSDRLEDMTCTVPYATFQRPNSGSSLGSNCEGLGPFFAIASVLMLVQGVYAGWTGLGAIGDANVFGISEAILVIGVRMALLVACALIGDRISPSWTVLALSVLWAIGMALCGIGWGNSYGSAGALVMETGLYSAQVLILVVATATAKKAPESRIRIASFAWIAATMNQVTRLISSTVLGGIVFATDSAEKTDGILFAAVIVSLTIYHVSSSMQRTPGSLSNGKTTEQNSSNDPFVNAEIEWCHAFNVFCDSIGAAPRERDVLFETAHGRTIDACAQRLNLSRETVKTYLSRCYGRAGVSSRQEILDLIDTQVPADGIPRQTN